MRLTHPRRAAVLALMSDLEPRTVHEITARMGTAEPTIAAAVAEMFMGEFLNRTSDRPQGPYLYVIALKGLYQLIDDVETAAKHPALSLAALSRDYRRLAA